MDLTTRESEILFSASIPGIFAEETARNSGFSMVTRHFHESLELYFLLEGERFYFIDQDTYHISQGMAVLVDHDQIHKTSIAGTHTGHRRFLLQIDAGKLAPFLNLLGFPHVSDLGSRYRGIAEFDEASWAQALALMDGIKLELGRRAAQSQNLAVLRTLELLMLFCQNRADSEYARWKSDGSSHIVHTGMYRKVHEIALHLQNNSSSEISLDDLARQFFISKSYLTRIFKSVTGFTVTEYLTFCRVNKARMLLTETALSVTEIAGRTGFGNVTYFERVFHKATGMPPLRYRKQDPAAHKKR